MDNRKETRGPRFAIRTKPRFARVGARCALLTLLLASPWAKADCEDDEILEMSKSGRTVHGIAKACEMEAADVRAVLDSAGPSTPRPGPRGGSGRGGTTQSGNENGPGQTNAGIGTGQPAFGCGCWGNAYPGAQFAHPACASGQAVAYACPAYCATGGYMWYAVCR